MGVAVGFLVRLCALGTIRRGGDLRQSFDTGWVVDLVLEAVLCMVKAWGGGEERTYLDCVFVLGGWLRVMGMERG